MTKDFAITLDIDWAPDWMITEVAEMLVGHNVKATWFITHKSEALTFLYEHPDLFEIGIHPNCLPGSTHGDNPKSVMEHILAIAPNATSMRTHGLYQSTPFLKMAAVEYGISTDISLYIPRSLTTPIHQLHFEDGYIWRVPFFWEDDMEMAYRDPLWTLSHQIFKIEQTMIFNFHPIHICLNTNKFETYEKLKGIKKVTELTKEDISPYRSDKPGPRSFFLELISQSDHKGSTVSELTTQYS